MKRSLDTSAHISIYITTPIYLHHSMSLQHPLHPNPSSAGRSSPSSFRWRGQRVGLWWRTGQRLIARPLVVWKNWAQAEIQEVKRTLYNDQFCGKARHCARSSCKLQTTFLILFGTKPAFQSGFFLRVSEIVRLRVVWASRSHSSPVGSSHSNGTLGLGHPQQKPNAWYSQEQGFLLTRILLSMQCCTLIIDVCIQECVITSNDIVCIAKNGFFSLHSFLQLACQS